MSRVNYLDSFFQIPGVVIDNLVKNLSGNELKCYLCLARKVTTKKVNHVEVSIHQFSEETGIKDKRTVKEALKSLQECRLIVCEQVVGGASRWKIVEEVFGEI